MNNSPSQRFSFSWDCFAIEKDRSRIEGLGRRAGTAHRVHQLLQRRPIVSIPLAAKSLEVSAPTARAAVEALETLKIRKEITGKLRDRLYIYDRYMKILDEGTEPLRPPAHS